MAIIIISFSNLVSVDFFDFLLVEIASPFEYASILHLHLMPVNSSVQTSDSSVCVSGLVKILTSQFITLSLKPSLKTYKL